MNNGFNLSAPKQTFKSNVPVTPQGAHVAILVRMVDLGRQWSIWNGEGKWSPKIQFVFELPFETHSFKEGEEPRPKWLYTQFTFVIADNSLLKKFMEGALNRTVTDAANIGELLGKVFMAQVSHTPKKDGSGVWENINSVSLIDERARAMYNIDWSQVVAKNDVWGFAMDEAGNCFKSERFGDFGAFMQEKLLKSEQGQAFLQSGGQPYVKPEVQQNVSVQPIVQTPVQTQPVAPAPVKVEPQINVVPTANVPVEQVKPIGGEVIGEAMPNPSKFNI